MAQQRYEQRKLPPKASMASSNLKLNDLSSASTSVAHIRKVVLIGNYPPRRCGIATFTADVREALVSAYPALDCDVIAMTDEGARYDYPQEVGFTIRQNERSDYLEAARRINAAAPDVVCVQHEFGIFGGAAGEHLMLLLDAINAPVVSSLHTILERPNDDQRCVFEKLIARSGRVIVMAERGRRMLRDIWGVPAEKIVLVPHGAPDLPMTDTAADKTRLGFAGRQVLFTFGLLSPNKGIETAIRAMPAIAAAHPDALYVVLGATHPHLIAKEGEAYRQSLQDLVDELGVRRNVRFINAFTDTPKLMEYLRAADIYVTPYLNEAQITSGTLSYAAALGKPIISTPYWHAQELLANGQGMLTPFGDSTAIAEAAIDLLSHPERLEALRRRIYDATRGTVWSHLAERYVQTFERTPKPAPVVSFRAGAFVRGKARPEPSLGGVLRMTDSCGILQHSVFSLPDRNHGYCVDDNCRALILMHRLPGPMDEDRRRLANLYAAFVQHAWNEDAGAFRNFMSFERAWLEERGSPDSIGRSFWSLAVTAVEAEEAQQRRWAESLIGRVWPYLGGATPHLRTKAFTLLGLSLLIEGGIANGDMRARAQALAADLIAAAQPRLNTAWAWFEDHLSYDNARLPEALLRFGSAIGDAKAVDVGLQTLSWLCGKQASPSGFFRPVATEDFGRPKALERVFDQQPLEAAATIDACHAALETGAGVRWAAEAQRAYDWYLGANDLGASLIDENGECYDGLTYAGPNLNQGAESILSFQLATCAMQTLIRASCSPRAR
jgi:glycosyltransferase involved in cell wall biosynthesis